MASKVYPSEDGYTIRGIEPPGLRKQSDGVKRMFYGWVVEIGLRQKDRDLAQGLDKDGEPLRAISAATRKHRVSAMTPTGKGDPSAPPLEPGRQLSRTRSLLTGRAFVDHAEFWWKFDPFTGRSWADILYHQQEHGRDVFGLSPDALKRTMAQSWDRYKRWLAGKPVEMPVVPGVAMAQPIAMAGTMPGPSATFGIGPAPTGQFSGGMTLEERLSYFRQSAKVTIPGRPGTAYNRILSHIWGPGSSVVVSRPPVAVPVRVAALKPAPPVGPVVQPAPRDKAERMAISAAWRASLTAEERDGIRAYVGHGFKPVNEYLRSGVVPEQFRNYRARLDEIVSRADSALARARLDRGLVVWRGVEDLAALGLDPANLVGAEVTDRGFLSTSLDRSRAETFVREGTAGAIFRIAAAEGLPGGFVGDLAMLQTEQEVLFARGLTLRITGSRREKGRLIIEAELRRGR